MSDCTQLDDHLPTSAVISVNGLVWFCPQIPAHSTATSSGPICCTAAAVAPAMLSSDLRQRRTEPLSERSIQASRVSVFLLCFLSVSGEWRRSTIRATDRSSCRRCTAWHEQDAGIGDGSDDCVYCGRQARVFYCLKLARHSALARDCAAVCCRRKFQILYIAPDVLQHGHAWQDQRKDCSFTNPTLQCRKWAPSSLARASPAAAFTSRMATLAPPCMKRRDTAAPILNGTHMHRFSQRRSNVSSRPFQLSFHKYHLAASACSGACWPMAPAAHSQLVPVPSKLYESAILENGASETHCMELNVDYML